jgi:hypothetical protein
MSLIDFTDSANPKEIAFFDRGPIHEERLVLGGYWSTYWYDGKIYGTEIVRGLDVFELQASDEMSKHEIAAAAVADQGDLFNPQQQFAVSWPEGEPAVAMAYLDQLARSDALSASDISDLTTTIEIAMSSLEAGRGDRTTATELRDLADDLKTGRLGAADAARVTALKGTLEQIADRL